MLLYHFHDYCNSLCLLIYGIAEFSFDGFSVDMTRGMVAMSDVSFMM